MKNHENVILSRICLKVGATMAICYDKLFHLMIDKKISNVQLKDMAGVSANIITRLKRDEYISIESIEKICLALKCGVDDILEFIPEEEGSNNAD